MSLEVGKKAPDFKLFSDERKEVALKDFRGHNVVLNFYPAAFTGVCTAQLCDARDNMKAYEKLNAQVLGISIDTPFVLMKFKAENNYNFPLLSDFNKTVVKKYGMLLKDFILGMKGVSKRGVVVIDKTGIVRYFEVMPKAADMPDFNLQHRGETGGPSSQAPPV